MPVIPDCIPPFEIKAPTTSGDNGKPTASLWKDAERVFAFMNDERHLVAEQLYLDVKRRLEERLRQHTHASNGGAPSSRLTASHGKRGHKNKLYKLEQEQIRKEVQQVQALFDEKKELLSRLTNRCRLFKMAKQNLSIDSDWTYACQHFGITTFYRRESDGSLSIKLEGDLHDVPLFEQICVLKEVDLHYRWAPFCSSSMTIADLDKIDTIGWFLIGMPNFGLARDGCFRAIGCDCIEEDGSIVLAAQGVQDRKPNSSPPDDTYLSDDPIIQQLEIPPLPKRRGSGRMTIKKFEALFTVTSPTSATTRIVANVDPNMAFMPQSLLEFVMKHLAGVLLAKLQAAAKKVSKNPAHNEHAKRMRTERDFYKVWLMAKFQSLCDQKGWTMPHVAAFDHSDKDSLHYHRAATFNGSIIDATVMENMSAVSEPEPRHDGGSDSVSDISVASSYWRKNPLATYRRDKEERAKRKVEEKIAASRQMAAARLKPKQMDRNKLERLEALKVAKAMRSMGETAASASHVDDDDNASYVTAAQDVPLTAPQKATFRLHSHPAWLRVLALVTLMTTHVIVLYSKLVPSVIGLVFGRQPLFHFPLLYQGAVTISHLLLCALVDYLLCFVALMYTFSSLDLGVKAGSRIKRYYADNMAKLLAAKGLGIVVVATTKASLRVTTRFMAGIGLRILGASLSPMDVLQELARRFPEPRWEVVSLLSYSQVPDWMRNFIRSGLLFTRWCLAKLIESCNDFRVRDNPFAPTVRRFRQYAEEVLEPYGQEPVTIYSWSEESIATAQTLFTYSSVFLLTFLILFSLTAMRSRPVGRAKPPQGAHLPPIHELLPSVSELTDVDMDLSAAPVASSTSSDVPSLTNRASRRRLLPARRRVKKNFSDAGANNKPVRTVPVLPHAASI